MTDRDPRVDPRPGDLLEQNTNRRLVTSIEGGRVRYIHTRLMFWESHGWYGDNPCWTRVENWRKWAAGATVVRKAGDAK